MEADFLPHQTEEKLVYIQAEHCAFYYQNLDLVARSIIELGMVSYYFLKEY